MVYIGEYSPTGVRGEFPLLSIYPFLVGTAFRQDPLMSSGCKSEWVSEWVSECPLSREVCWDIKVFDIFTADRKKWRRALEAWIFKTPISHLWKENTSFRSRKSRGTSKEYSKVSSRKIESLSATKWSFEGKLWFYQADVSKSMFDLRTCLVKLKCFKEYSTQILAGLIVDLY